MKKSFLVILVVVFGLGLAYGYTRVLANSDTPDVVPVNELVQVTYGDPSLLDPAMNYETAGGSIIHQIYDPLITLHRENVDKYVPMLATGWQISPSQDVYTFTIRQNVTFHNGNALTPEDVAYTFQRGLLQGGYSSPQWLFSEALLGYGTYDICEIIDESACDGRTALQAYQITHPAEVANACQTVKTAIQADGENWQVVFNLAQPWSPLLNTLIGSWGSILDKEWSIANGAWNGDCATWQNYYNAYSDNPLAAIANGTGPYSLDHWTVGEEIVLARNPNYWRTEPMWDGGPSGPTMFEKYTRQIETDATLRADMLLNGDADWISFDIADYDRLYDQVLYAYDDPAGLVPTLIHPTGTLKLFRGGFASSASDVFFNFDIQVGGAYNYIGSGALDGDGIPVDFFSDIHARKAFNYSFDWDEYAGGSLGSSVIQRTGPIIFGLPGYDSAQPKYFNSPALAKAEFDQAWGGLVATNGFSLTIVYNTGNTSRLKVAQILKTNIEALDAKYHIDILELPWSTFLQEQGAGRLPLAINGWSQDIPHPHNWVVPYLIGNYADSQRLPAALQAKYEAKILNCLTLDADAARLCYEDIQTSTYEDALDIFLTQAKTRNFFNADVRGYYINPAKAGLISYYPLTKGELPSVKAVDPEILSTIPLTSTYGTTMTVEVPAGALATPVYLALTPDIPTFGNPADFYLGDFSFDIQAFDEQGLILEDLTIDQEVLLTIHYKDAQIQTLSEPTLQLFWWDGSAWIDAACGEYVRDLANNILQVPICHFSDFAIGGVSYVSYLPVIAR